MALWREREDELEDLLNRGALWAVTYGDLMSYLMIFFLIMFVHSIGTKARFAETLSSMQAHFGGKAGGEQIERLARRSMEADVAADLEKKFAYKGIEKFAHVTVTEQKILITLRERVIFESGSSELKPQARDVLMEFADAVRDLPNRILVEGHSDNVPIRGGRYASNLELSMARAHDVIQALVTAGRIQPQRISGSGYGEFMPVADNSTPEGRAMNRRIEISLLRAD
ncbi:MAG: flagellar motor protein MotB [Elusimicrobiota bacterium]|jgi:chemotaxis protein MotB